MAGREGSEWGTDEIGFTSGSCSQANLDSMTSEYSKNHELKITKEKGKGATIE